MYRVSGRCNNFTSELVCACWTIPSCRALRYRSVKSPHFFVPEVSKDRACPVVIRWTAKNIFGVRTTSGERAIALLWLYKIFLNDVNTICALACSSGVYTNIFAYDYPIRSSSRQCPKAFTYLQPLLFPWWHYFATYSPCKAVGHACRDRILQGGRLCAFLCSLVEAQTCSFFFYNVRLRSVPARHETWSMRMLASSVLASVKSFSLRTGGYCTESIFPLEHAHDIRAVCQLWRYFRSKLSSPYRQYSVVVKFNAAVVVPLLLFYFYAGSLR